jgi:hypothetical protein
MKYLLIITALVFSQTVSAQVQIQTDTSKGLNTAERAVMEMYQSGNVGNVLNVKFDNGSAIDLKTLLNLDMKGSSPASKYDANLFSALAYMDKKGFRLITSFSLGEYHTKFIFERKQ